MTRLQLLAAALMVVACVGTAAGAEWHVHPGAGTPIQTAINGAGEGDMIYVHAGTYVENVNVTKSLMIRSSSGNPVDTIVQAADSHDYVFKVTADCVTIRGFTIQNGYVGLSLFSSNNNTIYDNKISDNGYGISSAHSHPSNHNIISGNQILSNDYYGISIDSSNVISNNYISDNYYGIACGYNNNYNAILNNHIANNTKGIYLGKANNNNITGNEISNNSYGISIGFTSDKNTIFENTVTWNNYGIHIHLETSSNNNLIYHNNLIDNTYQAYDNTGTNHWDNGYPSGGNYWSDYIGIDTFSGADQNVLGSDGIGDTYYGISGGEGARDRYPFMSKGGWVEENIPPVASFTYSPLNPVVNQTVVFDLSSSYDPDGGIVYHQLNFGDGSGAEGPGLIETIGYDYSFARNYSVTLTVTDNDGYTASETKIISVVGGDTTISIADAGAPSSHTTTTQITINNMTNFGAATVALSYDPTVVRITSITAGDVGTLTANINNTAGTATIAAYVGTATGPDSPITFANIELLAVGSNGATSPLTLAITTLTDADENSVPATAESGVFTISGLRGDANDDGAVNAIDAMFVAQYTAGNRDASTLNMDNADANLDGDVDVVDAMFIAQYVAGSRTW